MNELQELLDKWQPRLGLSHWVIDIRYANGYEMKDGGRVAEVHVNPEALRAEILVLRQEELNDRPDHFFLPAPSIESSIVHELIHVLMSVLEEYLPKEADSELERTVVMLERAFCPPI